MTVVLWVLLGILLFLLALILIPVSIKIGYTDKVTLAVGVPGIYYPIFPKKEKKTKPLSKKKYEKLLLKDAERAEKKRLAEEEKAQKKKESDKAKQAEKEKKAADEGVTDEPIIYFYNPAIGCGDFHETQIFVIEIKNHRFFKEAE